MCIKACESLNWATRCVFASLQKMQRQSRALMREKVEVNRHVASALHAEQQILAGERQRLLLTLNCGGGGSSSTTAPGGGGLSSHGELATQSGAGDPAGGSGGGSWLSRSFARKKLGFGEKAATAGSAGGSASTGGGSVTLMHGGGGGADRSAAGAHSSLLSLSASSHHHHATSFAAPPQQHPHHAAWQSAPSHNPPSSGNNNPTPPQHARPPAQQASPHSATGVAGGPTAERSLRHVHSGGHSQSGALTLSSSSGAHPPLAAQHHQPHHHQPHHQQSASMAPHLSQSLAAQSRLPNAFSVGAVAGNRRQSELGGEAGEKAEVRRRSGAAPHFLDSSILRRREEGSAGGHPLFSSVARDSLRRASRPPELARLAADPLVEEEGQVPPLQRRTSPALRLLILNRILNLASLEAKASRRPPLRSLPPGAAAALPVVLAR